jgi:UDP-N-acetyl-D-glucosamine dehydrogenase
VAYKKDLGDWRESPAIHVMTQLLEDGVEIAYHDSFVPEIYIQGQKFNSVPLNNDTLASYELVIITTDHSDIDYHNLVSHAAAVLDTRGITRKLDCDKDKVTLL